MVLMSAFRDHLPAPIASSQSAFQCKSPAIRVICGPLNSDRRNPRTWNDGEGLMIGFFRAPRKCSEAFHHTIFFTLLSKVV